MEEQIKVSDLMRAAYEKVEPLEDLTNLYALVSQLFEETENTYYLIYSRENKLWQVFKDPKYVNFFIKDMFPSILDFYEEQDEDQAPHISIWYLDEDKKINHAMLLPYDEGVVYI